MNKEQQELLDDAYERYEKEIIRQRQIQKKEVARLRSQGKRLKVSRIELLTQEEFIKKCKTDTGFSKKWGLKIEERELDREESVFHYEKELYSPLRIIDQKIPVVPTKLITITYNNETIESYES